MSSMQDHSHVEEIGGISPPRVCTAELACYCGYWLQKRCWAKLSEVYWRLSNNNRCNARNSNECILVSEVECIFFYTRIVLRSILLLFPTINTSSPSGLLFILVNLKHYYFNAAVALMWMTWVRISVQIFLLKKNHMNQLLSRAPIISVGSHNSTRVNEGRKCWTLLAIKMQGTYRAGEGREEPAMYAPRIWVTSYDCNKRDQDKKAKKIKGIGGKKKRKF